MVQELFTIGTMVVFGAATPLIHNGSKALIQKGATKSLEKKLNKALDGKDLTEEEANKIAEDITKKEEKKAKISLLASDVITVVGGGVGMGIVLNNSDSILNAIGVNTTNHNTTSSEEVAEVVSAESADEAVAALFMSRF